MRKNRVGERFGRLLVTEAAGKKGGKNAWHCACDCGNTCVVSGSQLVTGKTSSCGCLQRELTVARSFKHGAAKRGAHSRAYKTWAGIMRRCYTVSNSQYSLYGGRGITVDARWHDFANFLADMGEPSPGQTIERVDNDGHYSPKNCIWADRTTQTRNRSVTRFVTYGGQTKPLPQWAEELGLPYSALYLRIYRRGWDVEKALKTPLR